MTKFTTEQRKNLSKKKMAMPDGSYPIRNRSDLRNAIASYGRAKNKPAVKAWIISRAKDLDCEDLIPDSWNNIRHMCDGTPYLIHYGKVGMRWGVRHDRKTSSNKTKKQKARSIKRQIKAVKKSRKKAVKQRFILSDSDLDKRIKRLEKEKRLKDLTESEITPGKKAAKQALSKVGNKAFDSISSIATSAASSAVKKKILKS